MTSIYWHDYETSGTDPRLDRPLQFAGIRTDEALNIIGQPLVIYARPSNDFLPHPEACLITGITPQLAREKGVPEAEFIERIHTELASPGTCGAGYNSIRFDDEFTRNTLYRNFFDPYAREWQNGNSRWDIIDLVRTTYALRPQGIEWPSHADGKPSFRLEDLTRANGIQHTAAHDALSDVHATLAVARLIRDRQPRLYHYLFSLRNKKKVQEQLNIRNTEPLVHVSGMIPSEFGCTALVLPLAMHPTNQNGVIVYDLRYDPQQLLDLDADAIRARVFTAADQLPPGIDRIPLKVIHANRCPVVAPESTLTDVNAERLHIDRQASHAHAALLARHRQALADKLRAVFSAQEFAPSPDPDRAIYSGGFFSHNDRRKMDIIRQTAPAELAGLEMIFDDSRIPDMLFRYRARNWPETLSTDEAAEWEEFRRERLLHGDGLTLGPYQERIRELANAAECSARDKTILEALSEYAGQLI